MDLADRLKAQIAKSEVRVQNSYANRSSMKKIKEQIKESTDELNLLTELIHKTKQKISDITEYLANQQSCSIQDVYKALSIVKFVIPNSEDVEPYINKGEFYIKDTTGSNIADTEGDGAAAIASVTVRASVLQHTDYSNFLVLDESLACVSDASSIKFSKYLPSMGKYLQIVLIEQKPTVFHDAGDVLTYYASKDENGCKIELVTDAQIQEYVTSLKIQDSNAHQATLSSENTEANELQPF